MSHNTDYICYIFDSNKGFFLERYLDSMLFTYIYTCLNTDLSRKK